MQARHPAHLECPLSLTTNEIRLIRLHPRGPTHIIECDFWKFDLTQSRPYYALSYVWGSKERPYFIFVNGWKFEVGKNLYYALLSLRSHNSSDYILLWVDAICIDQICTQERNHQVRIMGQIYLKCEEVFVWMGETQIPRAIAVAGNHTVQDIDEKCYKFSGDERDFGGILNEYLSAFIFEYGREKEFGAISAVVPDLSDSTMSLHCAWFLRNLADGCHLTDLPPFSSTVFEASKYFADFEDKMNHLQNHEWFSRLWVVQEVVLGPSVRIFFGSVSLPLQVFVKAMETYHSHTPRRCCLSSGYGHHNLRSIVRAFLQNFNPIVQLRRQIKAKRPARSLLELCLAFLNRKASMDVDRVYALLGLLIHDETSNVTPDYDRSPPEVYLEVSSDYIERTSSLLPLFFASSKNRYPELPSWAIDWTIFEQDDIEQHLTWEAILPLFGLSKNPPITRIQVKEAALAACGVEFDFVTILGATMDQSTEAAFKTSMKNWRDLVLLKYAPDDSYVSGCTWNDALLRTLCADCCWGANSARHINSQDIAFFSTNLGFELQSLLLNGYKEEHSTLTGKFFQLANGEQVPSDAHFNDIWGMVQSVIQSKKLFLTKRGYIGLANGEIASGDTIFLSQGAPAPLILRERNFGNTESIQRSTQYRLIGGCYIHGIMDKSLDELRRSDNECWKLFTLL